MVGALVVEKCERYCQLRKGLPSNNQGKKKDFFGGGGGHIYKLLVLGRYANRKVVKGRMSYLCVQTFSAHELYSGQDLSVDLPLKRIILIFNCNNTYRQIIS